MKCNDLSGVSALPETGLIKHFLYEKGFLPRVPKLRNNCGELFFGLAETQSSSKEENAVQYRLERKERKSWPQLWERAILTIDSSLTDTSL